MNGELDKDYNTAAVETKQVEGSERPLQTAGNQQY